MKSVYSAVIKYCSVIASTSVATEWENNALKIIEYLKLQPIKRYCRKCNQCGY